MPAVTTAQIPATCTTRNADTTRCYHECQATPQALWWATDAIKHTLQKDIYWLQTVTRTGCLQNVQAAICAYRRAVGEYSGRNYFANAYPQFLCNHADFVRLFITQGTFSLVNSPRESSFDASFQTNSLYIVVFTL